MVYGNDRSQRLAPLNHWPDQVVKTVGRRPSGPAALASRARSVLCLVAIRGHGGRPRGWKG